LEHFYTKLEGAYRRADFNNAVKDLQSIPYILFVEIGESYTAHYHAVHGLVITIERDRIIELSLPRNWFYLINASRGDSVFLHRVSCAQLQFGWCRLNNVSVAHHPRWFRYRGSRVSHDSDIHCFTCSHRHSLASGNGIWLFLVDWGINIGEPLSD